mgnify:CR=1 FL=1
MLVGCIELGGTSASVAVTDTIGKFLWKSKGINTTSTRSPKDSIKEISERLISSKLPFQKLAIASFGPLDIANGCIGNTPKPNWKYFPLVKELESYFPNIPIILETDVNAPAYSEYLALRKKDKSVKSVAYLTVGTGVGLGIFSDGKSYHGIMHPEFGHIMIPKRKDDDFKGTCPFHSDCVEGLISSGALSKRLGIKPQDLVQVPNSHPIWDLFSYYIGLIASNAAMSYSIDHFVVGGGIATGDGRSFIIDKANEYCKKIINGYVQVPEICLPFFLKDAGLVGASALALQDIKKK